MQPHASYMEPIRFLHRTYMCTRHMSCSINVLLMLMYSRWGPRAHINDGLDGSGPLVLFDGSGNAMLLSPLDNFMSASMWQDKSKDTLNYGIMGGVDSLPASFEYSTVAFCSTTGVGDVSSKGYNITDKLT